MRKITFLAMVLAISEGAHAGTLDRAIRGLENAFYGDYCSCQKKTEFQQLNKAEYEEITNKTTELAGKVGEGLKLLSASRDALILNRKDAMDLLDLASKISSMLNKIDKEDLGTRYLFNPEEEKFPGYTVQNGIIVPKDNFEVIGERNANDIRRFINLCRDGEEIIERGILEREIRIIELDMIQSDANDQNQSPWKSETPMQKILKLLEDRGEKDRFKNLTYSTPLQKAKKTIQSAYKDDIKNLRSIKIGQIIENMKKLKEAFGKRMDDFKKRKESSVDRSSFSYKDIAINPIEKKMVALTESLWNECINPSKAPQK